MTDKQAGSRERMITVEELREHLTGFPGKMEVDFSGLDFYRVKQRGDNLLQIEFNQQVWRDTQSGRVQIDNLDGGDDEAAQSMVLLVLKSRRQEIIASFMSRVVPAADTFVSVGDTSVAPAVYKVTRVVHHTDGNSVDSVDLYVTKTARRV